MLAHLRTVSLRRTSSSPPWEVLTHSARRAASSRSSEPEGEEVAEEALEAEEDEEGKRTTPQDPSYSGWLQTIGKQFEQPVRPRNWLGGKVPFPKNPTFKPPTPVSDRLRTQIYNEFMTNPEVYNVRKLSERHGLSIPRIDAILRLKGLEANWKKIYPEDEWHAKIIADFCQSPGLLNKPLQTGFLAGMEEILGVTDNIKTIRSMTQGTQELGEDAAHADFQMSDPKLNRVRERYERLFWEPVAEGQQPIVLAEVERQRVAEAARRKVIKEENVARAHIPPPRHEIHAVVERPGRPTVTFVDVGGKYVDIGEEVHRLKHAERRSKMKVKRKMKALAERVEAEKAKARVEAEKAKATN